MGRASWDLQGGANSVSQVARVSDSAPTCQLCDSIGGGFRIETMASACLSVWVVLALMPDTSVPPCMPLVPFKLLPWCWSSEGVSLSKFVWGFFKGNCLELQKFLPLTESPLGFATRSYGDLSSCHRNPGLGDLVWDWGSSLSQYPSQIFTHHMWM